MLKAPKERHAAEARTASKRPQLGPAAGGNGAARGLAGAAEQLVDASRIVTRKARAEDVPAIRDIVDPLVDDGRMLPVKPVSYYTSLQRFRVAERAGEVVGCAALHVVWQDLAEIRTVAVRPHLMGTGVGSALLQDLLREARDLGMHRLFCLTFETEFFARHGFTPYRGQAVSPEVYAEILRRYDYDVAHLLDLVSVKPNTLGNTCMVVELEGVRQRSAPAST